MGHYPDEWHLTLWHCRRINRLNEPGPFRSGEKKVRQMIYALWSEAPVIWISKGQLWSIFAIKCIKSPGSLFALSDSIPKRKAIWKEKNENQNKCVFLSLSENGNVWGETFLFLSFLRFFFHFTLFHERRFCLLCLLGKGGLMMMMMIMGKVREHYDNQYHEDRNYNYKFDYIDECWR